jgi:hypothetical protein
MADITVEQGGWNGLSAADRERITQIMTDNRLIQTGDRLIPGATPVQYKVAFAAANPLCTLGCNVAEAAAVVACGLLTGPAVPICIAAAHAAADFCRSKC